MDLTPEGTGDMDLARLDLVLGAFHSKLRLRDDQTDRYFRGLENRDIQVLAHPRGRIYNFRAGLTRTLTPQPSLSFSRSGSRRHSSSS